MSSDEYGKIVGSRDSGSDSGSGSGLSLANASAALPARGLAHGLAHGLAQGVRAEQARYVFVVHGRDEQARQVMFDLLRKLDLKPLEWEPLVRAAGGGSPYLGDVVATAPSLAQAALVLLTPDDVVRLHPELHGPREHGYEVTQTCQPRPNVLLELGMVLMAYPERTVIVEFGDLRPIADLAGRNVIRFDGSAVAVGKIVGRLERAGCAVDDSGADWRDTRSFQGLDAYRRRP